MKLNDLNLAVALLFTAFFLTGCVPKKDTKINETKVVKDTIVYDIDSLYEYFAKRYNN